MIHSLTHHGAQDMKIAQYRVEEFLKKIAAFNRKAVKLGLPEVKAVKIGSELKEIKDKDDAGNHVTYYIEIEEYDIRVKSRASAVGLFTRRSNPPSKAKETSSTRTRV